MLDQGRTGANIRLRPVRVVDAEPMVAALHPAATKNLQFFTQAPTLERQQEYLLRMVLSPTDELFVIERLTDSASIGTIGLHEIDTHIRNARLGLLIFDPMHRGHGYGREAFDLIIQHAFEDLQLNKIHLNVFADNAAGRERYQRWGFVQEGILREEYLLEGTYHDLVRMALLRREWLARHPVTA